MTYLVSDTVPYEEGLVKFILSLGISTGGMHDDPKIPSVLCLNNVPIISCRRLSNESSTEDVPVNRFGAVDGAMIASGKLGCWPDNQLVHVDICRLLYRISDGTGYGGSREGITPVRSHHFLGFVV